MSQIPAAFYTVEPKISLAASGSAPNEPPVRWTGVADRALVTDPSRRPTTLAEAFDFVARHPEVPEKFREGVLAARKHIERLARRDAGQLPSDPLALRPLLASAQLKKFRISAQSSVFGALQSILTLTGWTCPETRMRSSLPRHSEDLLVAATKQGKRKILAPFFRFFHRLGLTPPEISTDTVMAYVDWLAQRTLDPDPWKTATRVRVAWRAMQNHHLAWPAVQIDLPPRRVSPFAARPELRVEPIIGCSYLANRPLIIGDAPRPATVGACLDFVAGHPEVPQWFRRDALGAKAALARLTGQDAADLPTDPIVLRPILATVEPILLKVSNKRWNNVLAVLRSTLILCGWLSAEYRKHHVLPEPWAGMLSAARPHEMDRPLAPFFRFCLLLGLTPEAVTTKTVVAYIDWITKSTLKPNPRNTGLKVAEAWRRIQRLNATWPRADISLPSRKVFKRRTDFLEVFYADVDAYLDSLRRRHTRDTTYGDPLAPASILLVRTTLFRAATFLASTATPISEITGIATLVTPEAFEAILMAALDEAGGRWSILAKQISIHLLLAAKRWVKPSEDILKVLTGQTKEVRVGRSDRRRRNLLAQFATPEDRQELFDLPWHAFEQADELLKKARQSTRKISLHSIAKLHEAALALALLFTQPIRIRNLASLDLGRHFERDRGKLTRIFIDEEDVKNSVAIEILLPDPFVARLQRHLEIYWPILLKGMHSTALFPGKTGMPLKPPTLGNRLRRMVEQQLGVRFTAHMARHLAAELLLEQDVGNLPIAQRLLGHVRPDTTAKIYGLVRTSTAQGVYARLLDRDRLAAGVDEGRKKKRMFGGGKK